jgi:phosphatidylglycerophosphate synthase
MSRITIITPALFSAAFFVAMLVVFAGLTFAGRAPVPAKLKSNPVFGPFWAGYAIWIFGPLERALIYGRVSPTWVTASSMASCLVAGVAVAFGHLAIGAWMYIIGGILDLLDGRLARAQNLDSRAGALFDSVADRWAELAMFVGYAWFLRDDEGWLLAALGASAGSMMVSYTRARCESLGVDQKGGAMQRAERMILVAVGTLVAAWFGVEADTAYLVEPTLGIALGLCGVLSVGTAIGRWRDGHRALVAKDAPVGQQVGVSRAPIRGAHEVR